MNRIKSRLRSKKGASITFALLLFLVCAIISSAVLVAGTSAAGRMSRFAESEQRYYSVTSTAKLIQSIMESGTTSVIKVKDENKYKYYIILEDENESIISNTLEELTEDTQFKSLRDRVVYSLCKNNADTVINLDAQTDELQKVIKDVTITESISGDHVVFKVESGGYTFQMKFKTNVKTVPVEIGQSEEKETLDGEKYIYSWKLSDAKAI